MSKNILSALILLLYSFALTAQPGRGRAGFERVEAEKIAFFTTFINLTSQEARAFWPVYDDFQKQKDQLVQERRSLSGHFERHHASLSDNESEEIADRYIELQIKEAGLQEEFHERFKAILPPGKVMRFYQAENEFRMQLLRRVRGGGFGRGPGRPE
jgi:hypothetical protein